MLQVCVVIPTKNEEKSIADVIDGLVNAFPSEKFHRPMIVVVDDSTDQTRRIARGLGATVLNGGGRGLGAAMYEGLKTAASFEPDIILAVDGDGQSDTDEIPRFLDPILKDEADMVLGSRFKEDDLVFYHYKFVNRFGTIVLSAILRRFTGLELTDSHGGLRAMRPEVARELEMLGTHTYVQETIIDAAEKGFRITEIASVWKKREHGSSRVVGNIPKYVFYTLPILILRSGQHIRMLYSAGIGLICFSLLYFLWVMFEQGFQIKGSGVRMPAFIFIGMMIAVGFNCFFFGLVLQLLKQIKYRVDQHDRQARVFTPKNILATGNSIGSANAVYNELNGSKENDKEVSKNSSDNKSKNEQSSKSRIDRLGETGSAPRGHR